MVNEISKLTEFEEKVLKILRTHGGTATVVKIAEDTRSTYKNVYRAATNLFEKGIAYITGPETATVLGNPVSRPIPPTYHTIHLYE